MNINENGPEQVACPICGGEGAFVIEVDRPVVLLCQCDSCGKFVIKKKVLDRLLGTKSFLQNRKLVSRFTRNFFLKNERPLEIVLDKKESIAKDPMTIEEILQAASYYQE